MQTNSHVNLANAGFDHYDIKELRFFCKEKYKNQKLKEQLKGVEFWMYFIKKPKGVEVYISYIDEFESWIIGAFNDAFTFRNRKDFEQLNMENKKEECKERRRRITKSDMYREEREEFIEEMNKILGLNDTKRNIYKYEIETNKEFEKYIKENIL